MSHEVYADNMEIAGKAGMNKSIARFPDVCMSPPPPPAGPIPVPYPDTSFSTDLKEGSQTVKLSGQPATLAQQSYYQPSVLGDEAATRNFGANVLTHVITGKTYFRAWSMDVKIEGKSVCRHLDLTTSNHGSELSTTGPTPTTEKQTVALKPEEKCPCCGEALHENQKGDDNKRLPEIKEADYYKNKADTYRNRAEDLKKSDNSKLESQAIDGRDSRPEALAKFIPGEPPTVANMIRGKARFYDATEKRLAELRAANPTCPNLHQPADVGCGTHFVVPKTPRKITKKVDGKDKTFNKTPAQYAADGFTPGAREKSFADWEQKLGTKLSRSNVKVNHKTPKEAGGCNSVGNLVPDAVVEKGGPACQEIETLQTELTNSGA